MRVGTFPAPWGVQTSTERSEVGANTPLLRSRRQTPLWRLSACTGEVYSIKTAVSGDYMEAIGKLKDAFWSNDEKVISEVSLGLQGVLYILKLNNGNTDVIKDTVLEIMQTLQYSDIKYVKSIWNILKQLIRRVFNEDDIYQAKLAEIFEKCMRSYSYQGKKGDKYYFEAMYNCNMTLKSYHDQIIENDFSLNAEMKKTINYVKSMGIFELLTIWE